MEPRVLVVDDHPDVRAILTRLLPKVGMAVAGEVASGEDAIDWCAANQVDVVVMDAQMPGMGGAQATVEIKRNHPQVTIVGFTAWIENEEGPMLEAGAAQVFEKTDVAGLLEALEGIATARSGE